MSTISKVLANPPANFSTTLSAGISSTALTISLNSVTGLGSEGIGAIYQKDSDGNPVASTLEFVHWTSAGASSVSLSDTNDRGISGSYNGAQAHSAGDTFEVWIHPSYYFRDFADVEHSLDGTHKTFTSPTVQGTFDSWIAANETWTYASATTITVPSGAASKYGVGDKIKFTQTGTKYAVIIAVADTLLTIFAGSDYSVANAAITSPYYSKAENPLGFPKEFASSSLTITAASGTFTSVAGTGKTAIHGRTVIFDADITITTNGTAANGIVVTLPVASDSANKYVVHGRNTTTGMTLQGINNTTTTHTIVRYDNTYSGADGNNLVTQIIYRM